MSLSWYVLIIFVILPLFFWWRVSYLNKRRNVLKSTCPACGHIDRLDHIGNYKCQACAAPVNYLDADGKWLESRQTYLCDACGTKNLDGILTCTGCGKHRHWLI